jgi:hypothetical protein
LFPSLGSATSLHVCSKSSDFFTLRLCLCVYLSIYRLLVETVRFAEPER